ncbi:hypothetical protein EV702DRAFT_460834 [Suillus placidus]|uniref:Uncharacterized protein n=1 Tax=Suillus placidus TaxID=48579 RepID=A0A9P6ZRE1_9AGAM|nr:hypothetical protein EV702DRAFT_460834 [Suillus placidus]
MTVRATRLVLLSPMSRLRALGTACGFSLFLGCKLMCALQDYDQPALNSGYSYSLPNSSTANACYCSWSSYNLMMACTLCQSTNNSVVWERIFPFGYVLAGDASIPYWATTDPTTWTYSTFNIQDASATYQKNPSDITPSASSSSSGSSSSSPSSSSSSKSSPSSDSINVGGIVGVTVGTLAALSFFAIGAYLVYRRHVYKKGVYASVINQQPFIDRGDGAATRMTHNHFPSDSSNFSQAFGSPALYGQSLSPSQYGTVYSPQPQMAYPSLQGTFSPPPRTVGCFVFWTVGRAKFTVM